MSTGDNKTTGPSFPHIGRLRRRSFLGGLAALGAGAVIPGCASSGNTSASQLERNKTAALRCMKGQAEKDSEAATRELLAPAYKQTRLGMMNLAHNARDQGYPSPGAYLRDAIPDRLDVIEEVIADGDTVGLLYRLTGAHRGNLFGIAPTGKKIDVHEVAFLRFVNGRIADGWFMADEAGLLKQLGVPLPPRKDGRRIVPPLTNEGEYGDEVLQRLTMRPASSQEERNKIIVARSKSSNPPKEDRAEGYRQRRQGLKHMRDYGVAKGTAKFTPTFAFPDRRDRVIGLLAEGDKVWMRFSLIGTHTRSFYGLPPTGHRVEMPEVGIMRFAEGKWAEGWYFGDELGILLQLSAEQMLYG
jgi:predicted ester cyclase